MMDTLNLIPLLLLSFTILGTTGLGTNETVYHTMLYVKVLNYTYPVADNTSAIQETCCRKMPLENCTYFCETVFSVCVDRCEKVLFNITYNYDTSRNFDENYGVGNIDTKLISNKNIFIDVTEVKRNLKTGLKENIPVDRLTHTYYRSPLGDFWSRDFYYSWQLQNKTKIALNVLAFCESGWYYPNRGCLEHIQADDLQEVHYNFQQRKLLPELDCKTEETSKINLVTHRPYKYTKSILEAQLAIFVADKVCSTRGNNISLKIVNIRYNKPLLRVVFSSSCSRNIIGNTSSVAAEFIEVSDLKITQALSFLSPYEERQYFTDPVLRTDMSVTRHQDRFQILFRLKQFSNPSHKYYTKPVAGGSYHTNDCPSHGCSPQFRFSYNGINQSIYFKGQAADVLQNCFGNLINPQNTREHTNNSILLYSPYPWDRTIPLQLEIYHNNEVSKPIGFLNISLASMDTVSSNYLHAHPRIVTTTIPSNKVSVVVEIMVWCSDGYYGQGCSESCPANDSSCNVQQCTTVGAIDSNHANRYRYFHCKKGKCDNGICVCPKGSAGSMCNIASHYSLPFEKFYRFKSNDTVHSVQCEKGFKGFNCDEKDYCLNNFCKHGQCSSDANGYACVCHKGYEGYNCDMENCANGNTGRNCETNIDDCSNITCYNNGSCSDGIANYTCDCHNGYTGRHCKTDIDDCSNVTCNNNGSCIDGTANYTCDCLNGYTGRNCETDIDDCSNVICYNNGSCIDGIANYACDCLNEYTGRNCETDIDDCSNVTCNNNGSCIDAIANYTCDCLNGYTGRNCETDIDDCSNVICNNNGSCIDGIANYACDCLNGYTGRNCETDIDDCSNVTCNNNGFCIDGIANFTCNCLNGYTGRNCETDIDDCSNVTCNNNGFCIDGIANFTCNCLNGYTGRNCETDIDDCSNATCNKNGSCIDGIANYACDCLNGYKGRNCETDIDDCSNVTCNNNGSCIDAIANYTCDCLNGYTGRNCETDIDDCSNVTCNNNGSCIDAIANYTCDCLNGYTGRNCETKFDDCSNITCNNRDLHLEDGIYTRCTSAGWNITVNMTILKQLFPSITTRNIHFGDSSCPGKEVGNMLVFQQGFGECLTSKRVSGNTFLYLNDLFYAVYDPIKPFIIRQYKWTYTVECDVNRNEATSSHVHHDVDTHHTSIMGHYSINMTFFKDVNFMNQLPGNPLHANVGDDIYVKVFTTAGDWTVKMRLHTCYTKPSDVADKNTEYYLIRDGCEVDSNTHIISQSTHETRFVFQDFGYSSNREGLNIYCNATFCETKDYSPGCAQSCTSPGQQALIGK